MIRFYNSINQVAAVTAGLLLWLLLPACSDNSSAPDLPDDSKLCTVTISLQTSNSMHPVTKAEDTPNWVEEEADYERNISKWLVVAYDANGDLAGYMAAGSGDIGLGTDDDSKTAVSQMELPVGAYIFYAFANLESLENGGDLKSRIMTGTYKAADFVNGGTNHAVQVGNINEKFNVATGKKLIPMSSYAYPITLSSNTTLTIPLIRMIGKVRVTISNELNNQPVEISNMFIGMFQEKRPIYLIPYMYENKNFLEFDPTIDVSRAPSFPDQQTTVAANISYSLITADETKTIAVGKESAQTFTTYVNESMLTSSTSTSGMAITLTRGSAGETYKTTTSHTTDFDFVRRNDLLDIPIYITDIETKLEFVSQRIPIGVFPKTITFGGNGTGIHVITPTSYVHSDGGDLAIQYTLTSSSLSSPDTKWQIRYKKEGSSYEAGTAYTTLELIDNENQLLIDTNNNQVLSTGEMTIGTQGTLNGSFTIRTQELAKRSSATLKLTIVVEDSENTSREILLPYTIYIWN